MRRFSILTVGMLLLAGSLQAQKGLNIGISAMGGQVFSKNVAIPKDSPYFIKNDAGIFYSGGLDVAYGFTENTTLQSGFWYGSKQFNLTPTDSNGNAFEGLTFTKTMFSIPILIRQRVALGQSGKTYLNFMAGHSLDMIKYDSTITPVAMAMDSGMAYSRRELLFPKRLVPTVILGVGLDLQSAKGNTLNLSLVWGLGTMKIIKGDIKEWQSLFANFDPATDDDQQPDQFPNYYYDFAMRGSYLSLRLSYWFNFDLKKKTEESEPSEGDAPPPPPAGE